MDRTIRKDFTAISIILQQGYGLSPSLFNFALEYTISKVHKNKEGV